MKQEIFDTHISTYWWNFGQKKNDFNGTISEWMKDKGVKYTECRHPSNKDIKGFRFKIDIGSQQVKYESYDFPKAAGLSVVKLFLILLGDRAQIKCGHAVLNINN